MAHEDRRIAGREIAVQRIDRQAEWLEVTLGSRLASYAAGLSSTELVRIAHRHEEPGSDLEEVRGPRARAQLEVALTDPRVRRGGERTLAADRRLAHLLDDNR